jgi:hypothetical protein
MNRLKITIGAVGAVAMLAIPAAASADNSPTVDGWQYKDNKNYQADISNVVGWADAQITHKWLVCPRQQAPDGH